MNVAELQPRHHAPPDGWDAQTFEAVTSALAAALSATYRRHVKREAGEPPERPTSDDVAMPPGAILDDPLPEESLS